MRGPPFPGAGEPPAGGGARSYSREKKGEFPLDQEQKEREVPVAHVLLGVEFRLEGEKKREDRKNRGGARTHGIPVKGGERRMWGARKRKPSPDEKKGLLPSLGEAKWKNT